MTTAALAWTGVRNVLCVSLGAVRDLLLASPAIRAIKQAKPGRRVTVLASHAAAPVARLIPDVDDVVAYDAPWTATTASSAGSARDLSMVERLRIARFGGAVIFTGPGQSAIAAALLCHLADIPLRSGFSSEDVSQLLTVRLAEDVDAAVVPPAEAISRQLRLAEVLGCPSLGSALAVRTPDAAHPDVCAAVERVLAEVSEARPNRPARPRPADVERPIPSAAEGATDEHDLPDVVGVVLDEAVQHAEDGRSSA